MKSQGDFVAALVKKLEESRVSYMITGSWGSGCFGEPRATNDVDFVIHAPFNRLKQFLTSLGEGYYFSEEAVAEAHRHQRMFNVIDMGALWKADLIVRKDRPYDAEAFNRRRREEVSGTIAFVASPEDIILSKLLWSKQADSERQFRDAFGVAFMQREKLDRDYLRMWARDLGVEDLLEKLFEQVAQHRLA